MPHTDVSADNPSKDSGNINCWSYEWMRPQMIPDFSHQAVPVDSRGVEMNCVLKPYQFEDHVVGPLTNTFSFLPLTAKARDITIIPTSHVERDPKWRTLGFHFSTGNSATASLGSGNRNVRYVGSRSVDSLSLTCVWRGLWRPLTIAPMTLRNPILILNSASGTKLLSYRP